MAHARIMAGLLAAALAPLGATAADFTLSGTHYSQKDVSWASFTVDASSPGVVLSTDSHLHGLNFDPLLTLWSADGYKLDQADDVDPLHGGFDALLDAGHLAAGTYRVSITASPNSALGGQVADGFLYDAATAHSLDGWCQPAAFDCTAQGLWRLNLQGVASAQVDSTTAVPEPASALLLLGGLAALGAGARRRSAQVHALA